MKRILTSLVFAALAAGCGSTPANVGNSGPRPPEGVGPAGTDFGYWNRDAEGSVDQVFRSFIVARYPTLDQVKMKADLEKDGFKCNTSDGSTPGAQLACDRLYKEGEDVHDWSVEVFAGDKRPRAHYSRTHIRDPMRNYDAKTKHH